MSKVPACVICFVLLTMLVGHVSAQGAWMITATSKAEALSQTAVLSDQLAIGESRAGPQGAVDEKPVRDMFASYKAYFKKKYKTSTVEKLAYTSFKQNLLDIAKTNSDSSIDFWLSGNNYTDMAYDDFKSKVLMTASLTDGLQTQSTGGWPTATNMVGVSSERNWVTAGKVSPIKYQDNCGSCWAFAATAAIESAHYIGVGGAAGSVVLSEQQAVDCVTRAKGYQASGCEGGHSFEVFNYVSTSNQLQQSVYPYTSGKSGSAGTCQTGLISSAKTGQAVQLATKSNTVTPSLSESALIAAVDKQPVVFYFQANQDFQQYSGGIYRSNCGSSINHAMLLVGYSMSQKYWLIRNSWGTSWGENGYARVAMTGDGVGPCGMYQYLFYPTLTFTKTIGGSPVPSPKPPPAVKPSPPGKAKKSPPPVKKKSPPPVRKSPPPPSPSPPSPPRGCTDIQDSCQAWNTAGYCQSSSKYYPYMVDNCPKSCGLCSGGTPDNNNNNNYYYYNDVSYYYYYY